MAPKKKSTGYSMFMQAERERIQAETKQTPSMQDMAVLCDETWKNLSAKEKAKYSAMAKGKSADPQGRDKYRLDNQGQLISERNLIAKEAIDRRTEENQFLLKSWAGKDILDVHFYIINFQVMYTEEVVNYLPLEVGLVCFTLRDGIIKRMHHFIDSGDVPVGNMNIACRHSENTHKIPLNFDKGNNNFVAMLNEIERFVTNNSPMDEIPPIFCLMSERNIVESCLEFMHICAGLKEPYRLIKIYGLEDLVMSLLLQSGKVNQRPSETQIRDRLIRNDWDHTGNIKCTYHEQMDCAYCALATVVRLSFSIFDMLSNTLEFKLTEQHRAKEEEDKEFTVVHPSTFNKANERVPSRDARHDRHRNNATRSSSRSTSPPSFKAIPERTSSDRVPGGACAAPKVDRVEVTFSDNEIDEDTDEIKSTADQHHLAELRKPTTPAMILPQLLPSIGLAFGRGLRLPGGRGVPSTAVEEPMTYANAIRPPPGFVTRPGLTSLSQPLRPGLTSMSQPQWPGLTSLPQPQNSTRPTINNPWTQPRLMHPPASSVIGRGRGRGMPRQA